MHTYSRFNSASPNARLIDFVICPVLQGETILPTFRVVSLYSANFFRRTANLESGEGRGDREEGETLEPHYRSAINSRLNEVKSTEPEWGGGRREAPRASKAQQTEGGRRAAVSLGQNSLASSHCFSQRYCPLSIYTHTAFSKIALHAFFW